MTYQKKFLNLVELHNFLESISDTYDAAGSFKLPVYSFATKDGVNHFGRHFQDFVLKLKEEVGIPVVVAGSFSQGYVTLNFEEDPATLIKTKDEEPKKQARKPKAKTE